MRRLALAAAAAVLLQGCANGPTPPVKVDTRSDACSWCRMAVSDTRFAAELVAPAEEPRIFDDIGCLRSYLRGGAKVPAGAIAYVADHRTKDWIVAARAVYTQVRGLATPMASGFIAHSDAASRSQDPDATRGEPRSLQEIFGATGPPGGKP